MRGHERVVALALASSLGCVARAPAELAAPEHDAVEPEGDDAEPLLAAALTDAPAPPDLEAGSDSTTSAVRSSTAPPLAFPGVAGEPLRSESLPDGLELHDYAPGAGRVAVPGDRVRVHYVGQLLDGTEFDSTYARATPFEIELGGGRMIPGMERGLEGVRGGMQRTVVIPPALAYADRAPGVIPAHATLVFHVEVLEVTPP